MSLSPLHLKTTATVVEQLVEMLKAFCPTGTGGGIDNSCSPQSSNKRTWKKLANVFNGSIEAQEAIQDRFTEIDAMHDGALSKVLDRHPLLSIMTVDPFNIPPELKTGSGIYDVANPRIALREPLALGDPKLFEPDTVSIKKGHESRNAGKTQLEAAEDVMKSTFTHEMGHHVFFSVGKDDSVRDKVSEVIVEALHDKDFTSPSPYALTSVEEYFAESFAQYHYDSSSMSSKSVEMIEYAILAAAGGI